MHQKDLAIFLSRLKPTPGYSSQLEQYPTVCTVAASALWQAFMHGDVREKSVADLGCGSGILGIGALILGARSCCFLDADERMIALTRENLAFAEKTFDHIYSSQFFHTDVVKFPSAVDTVIMNPPFGAQLKHADRAFLSAAFSHAFVVYSFHNFETRTFIENFALEHQFNATLLAPFDFPLPRLYAFHRKPVTRTKVGLWRFTRLTKSF